MRAVSVFSAMILLFASCGGEGPSSVTTEETGVFNAETLTDGNYGGYRYHEYQLTAGALDQVKVSIEADGFQPILNLYEGSTGAHLAEWDSGYSDDPCLEYRIASPGEYFVRVHNPGDGDGSYTLFITLEKRS